MLHPFITYVNSRFRSSGTPSDFTYVIELPQTTGYSHYDSACILQASIPKSFYLLNTGRDTFYLHEELDIIPITLPNGNYSRRAFAATLIALLNASSTHGYIYNVSVPNTATGPDTGKYLFSVSDGTYIALGFGMTTSPAEQMGFDPGSLNTFNARTLFSQNVTNLQVGSAVYILCDNVLNGQTQILQEVFTASPDYSMMSFNVGLSGGVAANKKKIKTSLTNAWRFRVTTPTFEVVDFEGMNLVFSLLIWQSGESGVSDSSSSSTSSQ
jgi:hypothetical protein